MAKLRGQIKGMDCASCVAKIDKSLKTMEGVKEVNISLVASTVEADYNDEKTSNDEIIKKIESLGYGFEYAYEQRSFFSLKYNKELIYGIIGLVALVVAVVFDLVLAYSVVSKISYGITIGIGGFPVFRGAYNSLRALTIDIDLLMVMAIVGAVFIGEWLEASMIVILFSFAELLEAYSMDKARKSIHQLMKLQPAKALKITEEGDVEEVLIEQLVVGDLIRIKPGERIPIDGKVEWGRTTVDQSLITGESLPENKIKGSKVYGGSINLDGTIDVRTTVMPSETTIAKITRIIEEAEKKKSKTEKFVQKFAKYYTPVMVSIAILVTVVPVSLYGFSVFNEWFYRSLVILVISCPCALVLSAPITVVSALTRALKKGILIKGGKYIESLADVKTLAIDKTGTLTTGAIKVYLVESLSEKYTEKDLLGYAYGLEQHSEHLIAHAIIEYSKKRNIKPLKFDKIDILPGQGIIGVIGDDTYIIGNRSLVCENGKEQEIDGLYCDETESMVAYVSKNNKVIGHIHMADPLRPEVPKVIKQLKQTGIKHIIMLTGDNYDIAEKIAGEINIAFQAELLPEEKSQAIALLQKKYGKVAMIGDGINDAPALAVADLSISMGVKGTTISIETADIVLANDNLANIPYMFYLSSQTKKIIKINIFLSLFIKMLFFVLVFFGIAILWMAVLFGDMGASLLVIFNALMVGRSRR